MSPKERHPTNSMIVLSSKDIEAIAVEVLRHLDTEAIAAAVVRQMETKSVAGSTGQSSSLPVALPPDGYLRLPEILKLVPVSAATWWRWVKAGKAPRGMKLGSRMTAWDARDIRDFVGSLQFAPPGVDA